ncbi:MAG: NADH-quinone oxidoreductase subunit J [Candidatus Tectomicrobia bacterium]|uniref:NADH-quinone oxidoreductase subunit J n=1 Tax=Tectimicrobiota bacterium TaxID=2528274 RepID=A0A932MNE6_UNCTE|nr:NADH-quinone oxidoreductase subunit J [Candidatus Tectomicrobia bacterium]
MAGQLLFYLLALMTVGGAVAVVALPNPLYCVLSLVLTFLGLAGLYLSLNAQFVAVVQVIVYAGAIMMLFLFVVMLIDLRAEERGALRLPFQKLAGTIIALGVFAGLINLFVSTPLRTGAKGLFPPGRLAEIGTVQAVGKVLVTQYVLPFQAMGVLLFVGIVGAVVLAQRRTRQG